MLHLTGSSLAGGSIGGNEEELIACGDCADYILNLKLFPPQSTVLKSCTRNDGASLRSANIFHSYKTQPNSQPENAKFYRTEKKSF